MNKKNITLISASPKTRKFARELGADIGLIEGSQREGRINESDVKIFIKESLSGKLSKNKNQDCLTKSRFLRPGTVWNRFLVSRNPRGLILSQIRWKKSQNMQNCQIVRTCSLLWGQSTPRRECG